MRALANESGMNYEGYYMVSSKGRVKSLSRTVKVQDYTRTKKGRMLKMLNSPYLRVNLSKNGVVTKTYIHRIVAESFVPNPFNKSQVNHKNGIKTDNRPENLEWCTRSENMKHASKNGLLINGEDHYRSKLTDSDVNEIRSIDFDNMTKAEVAKQYNVSRRTIHQILSYKTRIYLKKP